MVLQPYHQKRYRLIIIGRKHLPSLFTHEKEWAMVDTVGTDPNKILDELKPKTYTTKTRGKRVQQEARACGEGVYGIIHKDKTTYFIYELELPKKPKEAQHAFQIASKASFVLAIKNQAMIGSQSKESAHFPKKLQSKFRTKRFISANLPDFLNYPGAELILIGAHADRDEFDLAPEKESLDSAEIFNELRLWKNEHTVKPLFEGHWA
jgi:hypothetical protein